MVPGFNRGEINQKSLIKLTLLNRQLMSTSLLIMLRFTIFGSIKPTPLIVLPVEKRCGTMEARPLGGVRNEVLFHALGENIGQALFLTLRGGQRCGREPGVPYGAAEIVFLPEAPRYLTLDIAHKGRDLLRLPGEHEMEK